MVHFSGGFPVKLNVRNVDQIISNGPNHRTSEVLDGLPIYLGVY